MPIIFTLALLGAVVPFAPIIEQPAAPLPHVRALTSTAREIVAAGLHESTTFRQLVRELDAANIVVYVATTPEWATRASLNYLSSAASITYLLVHVRTRAPERDRIAALAHELRHALEIVGAPTPIVRASDLRQLYASVGFACGPRSYDSAAAALTEAAVRRELDAGSTRRPR